MEDLNITVIKSNRKTCSLQVKNDLSVVVRVPLKMKTSEINDLINDKMDWIKKSLSQMSARNLTKQAQPPLSRDELNLLRENAQRYIPLRVRYYAELMNVEYGRITIRRQKTRWGSCSSKGNLNFNCLIMLAPPSVIDYIIVHELCHIEEMNHSKAFWKLVENVLPDYKESYKWLKINGNDIMKRITE